MEIPHVLIKHAGAEQFLVCADSIDLAVLQHHDLIASGDGGEPMGDDDQRLS